MPALASEAVQKARKKKNRRHAAWQKPKEKKQKPLVKEPREEKKRAKEFITPHSMGQNLLPGLSEEAKKPEAFFTLHK